MDCVSSVFQTSFRSENFPVKSNQKEFNDEIWTGNLNDDKFIDEFLDFSNEEVGGEDFGFSFCALEKGLLDGLSDENSNSIFSVKEEEFEVVPESKLSGLEEDLSNLEWVSRFLEEPSSELPSFARTPLCKNNLDQDQNQTSDVSFENSRGFSWEITVPAKARSKRQRAFDRTQLTESTSCSSSSSSISSSGSFKSPPLIGSSALVYFAGRPPVKKQNKGRKAASDNVQRHCSHCLVQKTPQWRAGPLGAKTLCNACGVRYKSGRLFPEYRPAGSPSYSSEVHSNHHRKVLEMRRLKEMNQTESHSQVIQSF